MLSMFKSMHEPRVCHLWSLPVWIESRPKKADVHSTSLFPLRSADDMLIVARNAVEAVKMEDVVDTLHNAIACGEN